ncbi:MAG: toll/interleukin-1 receptor domain-containing protein, partial [Clostridia bacterium]|nr:toll/interleukin-1 receptor domain-containing protein [Clostridia bacterium]
MQEFTCSKCGGSLVKNGDLYQCAYCHTDFKADNLEKEKKALAELLDEQKQEKLSNLRRLLWTEIHEEYIDSEKIVELCSSIQKISPDDFEAKFFTLANGGSEAQINAFLRGVDFSDSAQAVWAEEMVRFMLKSLRAKNLLAVQNLIERAFKNTDLAKYEKYSTVFSREAERVSRGVYEPSLPRDVFVMYSSKDMQTVESLVETLEERGLTCFVATRNLQHGRGATANYQQALETAMSACKTIVFVSSKYSRSMSCDAVRVEIPYFMAKDKENSPFEFRQRYDKMPAQYKKSRVEYRLDNESSAENSIVKEFFGGLEYAYSKEEVAKRIEKYLTQEIAVSEEPKTAKADEPNQKYQELLEQYNRLQEQVKKDEKEPKQEEQNSTETENKPPVVEKKAETKEVSTKQELTKGVVRDGKYLWFGEYPQSKKPANV